ncbi:MAG: TonB-dependent receptor plug domain-containing protein, partial [Prolixibacteraceae bacterium]|nr:TonB-dependent receptor plug domain-containing protein [Prolixibacteraceae bacterium]
MKRIFFLFLSILPLVLFSQNDFYILKAKVIDEQTDLPLPGATVTVKEIGKQFISDRSGLVKMALVPGAYTLITTHDDYVSGIKKIVVASDSTFTIELKPFEKSVVIEEVTVIENMPLKSNRIETGLELLSSVSISSIPAIAGEKDLIKSLAMKPGMQTASEGVSRLIVRGGNPDQNLFLINGLPIYQTNHFFSFLSVVNTMLIDQVEVYKSGFPAHYGGRVSSVIDMEVKTPGMDRVHGEGDIGLLSAKAVVSVPIIKNKLAVMASARRTYLDLLGRAVIEQLEDLNFSYTDFSLSVNWNLSDKNTITFFNYYCRDDFTLSYDEEHTGVPLTDNGKSWDNLISGIQWNISSGRFSNDLKAGYSGNQTKRGVAYGTDTLNMYEKMFYSRLQNFILTDHVNYELSDKFLLDAGLQFEDVQLAPASLYYSDPDTSWTQQRIAEARYESCALWASVNYEGIKFKAQAGLRGSLYLYNGITRFIAEPRVNLQYFLSGNNSLKASYSRISQPLHLLSNTGLGLPVDLWTGPSESRKPMISDQWAAGYYMNFPVKGRRFEISIEGFYKATENLVSYRDGFSSDMFTTANYIEKPTYLDEVIAYG